jgi:hypothetical protein
MISNRVQVGSTVSKFELFAGYVVTDYICTVKFRISEEEETLLVFSNKSSFSTHIFFFSLFPNG